MLFRSFPLFRRCLTASLAAGGLFLLASCQTTSEVETVAAEPPERADESVREAVNESLREVFGPVDRKSELLEPRYR